MPRIGVKLFSIVFALALPTACVTINRVSAPPCPSPQEGTAEQISYLMESAERYMELVDWISELDRYCNAIDSLQ